MKLKQMLKTNHPSAVRELPMATEKQSKEMRANEAYTRHAANMLPELLAAAKNLQDNWEHNLTEPMARLNEAIALAENVTSE